MPPPRLTSEAALSIIEVRTESPRGSACYSSNAVSFDAYFVTKDIQFGHKWKTARDS